MNRTSWRLLLVLLPFLALLALTLRAQPPGMKKADLPPPPVTTEEEDELPTKPKRKVVIEEEGPPAVVVPRGCFYVRLEDLARAAADTKHAGLKALLARHVIAFDRIQSTDGTFTRVCPVPLHRDGTYPDFFGLFPLDDKNEPKRVISFGREKLVSIRHYEDLAAEAAKRLLDPPKAGVQDPAWTAEPAERYLVAEQLLAAALQFHDTARDASKRRGTQWERVRLDTVKALADTRLKRLQYAGERKDWATVRGLGSRMAGLYTKDMTLLEAVFAARLSEGVVAAGSDQLADLERAKELLIEFESRFPGSKNATADAVRTALKAQAESLYKKADAALRNEDKAATRLLRTLEIVDPTYPGLRDLMGQLKGGYSILNVGVTRLPTSMSPLTAHSDADKMVVELVFEGLLEPVPDDTQGVRYLPNLAADFPTVGGGVRGVRLARPVEWAGLKSQYADASDVAGTLRLLKGDYRGTWAAAPVDFLSDQVRVDDPASLRLAMAGSHPYPLSLLNFKILPTRWLAAEGLKPDDAKFVQHPYGSGPYKCLPDKDGRVTGFVANPAYGRRPGKLGQPFIREVQFIDVSKKDAAELVRDFKTEKIHLLPDVPTAALSAFSNASSGLVGRVQVVTAAQNRRVWILAINHRKPSLRSVPLRRGIALAIDRETILKSTFRAGYGEFHKAMASPFPPETWPLPRTMSALFSKDLATAKMVEHIKASGSTILRLAVPADDKQARMACEAMAKQIEEVGKTAEGSVTVIVDLLPRDQFDRSVYREMNYDLAYVPFDYPNDWYPFGLSEYLDPGAAMTGGRNLGGYLDKQANTAREDEDLARLLAEVRHHADYTTRLLPLSKSLHGKFLEAMPFVPLWQLDRHMVISTKLQISFDDEAGAGNAKMLPASIFARVGRWKLE